MGYGPSAANANLALDSLLGTNAGFAQLHDGAPGAAGTANVSSVTARKTVTYSSASAGSKSSSGTAPLWSSWAGTNGEVVTALTLWSASTSGTFGMSLGLSSSVTMNTGDDLTIDSITASMTLAS